MEQKQGIVKSSTRLPKFVEDAYDSVDKMEQFAELLLKSKLCPDHFYEKVKEGTKNVPDYTKGRVSAVVMVLLQGYQLDLPPMTALQHIIPVNGLLSIKGDAAKTLIFNSGKLAPGSWKEEVSGSVKSGDMSVTITAQRNDTKEVMSRSFSVEQAKRAGLWIEESKLRGADGWRYQKSAWYKYPQRMITYRALGFLARDLFPDVLSGIYTTEEAMDMPKETEVIIQAGDAEIVIPDKNFNQERSENLTHKANHMIDKTAGNVGKVPVDEVQTPLKATDKDTSIPIPEELKKKEDAPPDEPKFVTTMLNGTPGSIDVLTEKQMMEMDTQALMEIVDRDDMMIHARDIDPGKNTNKKIRNIILAKYEGNVVSLIEKFDPEYSLEELQKKKVAPPPEEKKEDEIPMEAVGEKKDNNEDDLTSENNFGILVTDIPEGETRRPFEAAMIIFNEMADIAGIDNQRYIDLIPKYPPLQKYTTRELFCFEASTEQINLLLNSI